jgi:hypothetical protein
MRKGSIMNGKHTAIRLIGRGSTRRGRAGLAGLAVIPATLVLLAGCAPFSGHGTVTVQGQTAGPAGVTPSTASSSASSGTSSSTGSGASPSSGSSGSGSDDSGGSSSSGGSSRKGCAPGGAAIPAGAGTARTVDLDGDGKADTIWIADVGQKRELGVRTAGGAGFFTAFQSAAPQSATAVANRLSDDSAIILLDTGRAAALYAVADCSLVATKNAQNQPYTFDQGFTGYGTGAGCPVIGSGRRLAGYDAKLESGSAGTFTVTRTTISLSNEGRKASNGSKVTIGTHLSASSSIVRTAQAVTCGTTQRALEPQS